MFRDAFGVLCGINLSMASSILAVETKGKWESQGERMQCGLMLVVVNASSPAVARHCLCFDVWLVAHCVVLAETGVGGY